MAAFIDEDMNILHVNTFVLYACIEKIESLADILNFFFHELKNLGISCSDTLVLTHLTQVSLCNWSYNNISHHGVFGVAPPTTCFQWPLVHSLGDSLESTRLLILKRIANCFQRLFPLLFFHQYCPD